MNKKRFSMQDSDNFVRKYILESSNVTEFSNKIKNYVNKIEQNSNNKLLLKNHKTFIAFSLLDALTDSNVKWKHSQGIIKLLKFLGYSNSRYEAHILAEKNMKQEQEMNLHNCPLLSNLNNFEKERCVKVCLYVIYYSKLVKRNKNIDFQDILKKNKDLETLLKLLIKNKRIAELLFYTFENHNTDKEILLKWIKTKLIRLDYIKYFINHYYDIKQNTNYFYVKLEKKFTKSSIQKIIINNFGEKFIPPR